MTSEPEFIPMRMTQATHKIIVRALRDAIDFQRVARYPERDEFIAEYHHVLSIVHEAKKAAATTGG